MEWYTKSVWGRTIFWHTPSYMHFALAWQKVVWPLRILEHCGVFFYASMKTQSADLVPGVTEHITMQWRYNVVDSGIISDTGYCCIQISVWSKKLPIILDKMSRSYYNIKSPKLHHTKLHRIWHTCGLQISFVLEGILVV